LFDKHSGGGFLLHPDGRMSKRIAPGAECLVIQVSKLLDTNLFEDHVPDASQRGRLLKELSEGDSLRNHEATCEEKTGATEAAPPRHGGSRTEGIAGPVSWADS